MILEGLCKSKLQNSAQLQTVFDQETARNKKPNCQQLKTALKLHVDQMMRTRHFRVRNDVVERGSAAKSQKGKKPHVERKVGLFSVEGTWTIFRKKLISNHKTQTLKKKAKVREKKDERLLLHPIRRQNRLTARYKNPHRDQATKRKVMTREVRLCADTKNVKTRRVNLGIFPRVKITSLNKDAYMATNAISDMLRQKESPAQGQRKVVQKDQLRY